MTADHRGNISAKGAYQGVRFYPITAEQKVSNGKDTQSTL